MYYRAGQRCFGLLAFISRTQVILFINFVNYTSSVKIVMTFHSAGEEKRRRFSGRNFYVKNILLLKVLHNI